MMLFRRNSPYLKRSIDVRATLGNFDGVHLGHQALLRRVCAIRDFLVEQGRDALALLISFSPHPDVVVGKAQEIPHLTTLHQKAKLLSELSIDAFQVMHFSRQLAGLSAERFVKEYLIEKCGVSHLVLGPDARIGRDGSATASVICDLFDGAGGASEILDFEEYLGERISSGRIRRFVETGDLDACRASLGRRYAIEGRVARGYQRGRKLGYATANIEQSRQLWPPYGVYATKSHLKDGRVFYSLTNIGVRPTFGSHVQSAETHLLDYTAESLYGERIEVSFLERLRGEMRFSSAADLSAQIKTDIENSRIVFARLVD